MFVRGWSGWNQASECPPLLIWCSVLTIIVDSWSKTASFSLQCAFLSPLLNYNWLWYQLTRTVYYRLYTKDGPLESNHPIYSNDRFISRIASTLVRPPQTAASLTRYLCKIEGLEHRKGALYQSLSDNTPLDDSTRLLFRGTSGPGPSGVDPVALIVDTGAAGKRSQASSSVEFQKLSEWDYDQRYGEGLLCFVKNNFIIFISLLSRLRWWWWGCLKNVFRRERSLLRPCQHSFCAPASHRILLEEFYHDVRRHNGARCSATWGWGQRVCYEW